MAWCSVLICCSSSAGAHAQNSSSEALIKAGWPQAVVKIKIQSSLDGTRQDALMYRANGEKRRPLLVGLHTWSGDYLQAGGEVVYARWCQENNWHFIHPNFRGPNRTPQALGSELAVQDVLDAVNLMKKEAHVDPDRVYLIGVSGGGHAALLLAGRAPKIWAGVSAWCPISDVEKWWRTHAFPGGKYQPGRYAKDIEKAIGGRPDERKEFSDACRRRSPLTYLGQAAGVHLDINHGIHDGRKGSVPFTHSIEAFNMLAKATDKISQRSAEAFYQRLKLPPDMKRAPKDESYATRQPVFRTVSGNCRLTIFQGGHEIVHLAALNWLAFQKKGQAAVWKLTKIRPLNSSAAESAAQK